MNRKNGAVMPKNLTKSVMYDIIQIYICNADTTAQHSIAVLKWRGKICHQETYQEVRFSYC